MAQYKFEGTTDNVSEPQLKFIHKIIVENGFENSKVTFEPVGKAGDNFMANVQRIIIEGENGNLNMIAKVAPTVEIARQMAQTAIAFRNEHIIYTEVLPAYVELQKKAGIPESEHIRYAKCYGSQTEAPHEVILLEDLKTSQYVMMDRFKSLSNDCVRSVLKKFAVLHSLSYALKNQHPEKYDSIKENLIDNFQLMAENEMMQMYFIGIENDTVSILEDTPHKNWFKNKITDLLTIGVKLTKADKNSKYNVIQHGDTWTNNIMFKFEGDKVTDSILIDFQQSKSFCPVSDILCLIFNCTDYETRKPNFYDWIDYYHLELDNSLANFNLKANYIYPRDKLDADIKRYGRLLFGLSVLMANMMTKKSEQSEKMLNAMTNKDLTNETMMEQAQQMSLAYSDDEVKAIYKSRVIGLINSFTEFGII